MGYSPWDRKESDTTEQLHFTSETIGALVFFQFLFSPSFSLDQYLTVFYHFAVVFVSRAHMMFFI